MEANLDDSATTVSAYVIAEDGSREPVQSEPAPTDGSGRYTLLSTVELDAGTHLLLEATDGSEQASVVVVVEGDGSMTAEPMNEETSFEAAVFAELEASASCEDCTFEAVRTTVEAEAAATFAAGSESAAALEDASAAIQARIDAEATVLAEESSSAFNAYVNARAEATEDETEALHASTSAQATAEAHADFAEALAEARSSSAISAEAWAESAHAGAEAMRLEASEVDLDASLYAQLIADAELERASSLHAAMQAELDASGADDVDLEPTFVTLTASIEAARADGEAAGDTIAEAWATAAVSIRAEISASLETAESTAFDAWASFSTTLVATLRSDVLLGGGSSVESAVLFSAGLDDLTVDVTALTTAGIDGDMAEAFASILLHAELAATAQ